MQLITRHICCLIAFLFLQAAKAQNLVANPSFEDVNTCAEYGQPCSPSAWFFLSRKFTTGYYPLYPSATGSRHLRMIAASGETPNRQYWETMLLCPLQPGQRYKVSLRVANPADPPELSQTPPKLEDIGVWFTDRFIFVQGDSILQPRHYLSFTDAAIKDLNNGWFEISKEFIPSSNASILIVGNFSQAANASIIQLRGSTETILVLVDDIAVTPLDGLICANYEKVKDSLYSIIWRHSQKRRTLRPNSSIEIPKSDTSREEVNTPRRRTPNNPIDDPLFGPEPRRTIEKPSLPAPPLKTDTIVIRDIHFDFDKYLVKNPDTLQRYRSLLTRPGIERIQIIGFTDDAGSEAYNLALSQKRAQEIAKLLSSEFDISPTLLEPEGRGISKKFPTADLNRRVEIYIYHE